MGSSSHRTVRAPSRSAPGFVLASSDRGQASAHLISLIGGDSEIGALSAGATEGALFQIHLPGRPAMAVSLGPEAQCFRGSAVVSNRERPVRHLVAISSFGGSTTTRSKWTRTRVVVSFMRLMNSKIAKRSCAFCIAVSSSDQFRRIHAPD